MGVVCINSYAQLTNLIGGVMTPPYSNVLDSYAECLPLE